MNLKTIGVKNPLADMLEITLLIGGGRSGFALFRLPDGTGEFIARVGAKIADPYGKELEGFEGWRLTFIRSEYCTFEKDSFRAPFLKKDGTYQPLPSHAPRK